MTIRELKSLLADYEDQDEAIICINFMDGINEEHFEIETVEKKDGLVMLLRGDYA